VTALFALISRVRDVRDLRLHLLARHRGVGKNRHPGITSPL